ncbi:nucleotide disphospho-sugar-binding domain-containing protein [Streptomyces sp. NPDC090127]|uniref:nucleotide disphospho-sugar-binding domain-containing protein n=1 Tax=Streptomyces sp. NPDC090127 TaxID=3365953 RepID=UPI003809C6AE
MRVLFTVWPAQAHLLPTYSLAAALQAAGHDVRVAGLRTTAESARAIGLTGVSLGGPELSVGSLEEIRARETSAERFEGELDHLEKELALDEADGRHWQTFRQFPLSAARMFHPAHGGPHDHPALLDELIDFADRWQPDLVLWDPIWPSSAIAARLTGAAHARLLWGQDYHAWAQDRIDARTGPGAHGPHGPRGPLADLVRGLADHHGVQVDEELLFGQWSVDPMPAAMRLSTRTRTVPMRWIPYTGPASLPTWMRESPTRPRVAVTLGSSVRTFAPGSWTRWVDNLLETVDGLDIDVVATFDDEQLAGRKVPDNVRALAYVPLAPLLPTCSALIHHGGSGTHGAAVAHGVPQLITLADRGPGTPVTDNTMGAWSFARHIEERGAGLILNQDLHSVSEMRERLDRVVHDPSFREGARALRRDALAVPSPMDLVPTLEELTARHRVPA